MLGKTRISAADDKGKLSTAVESSLNELSDRQVFEAQNAGARQELLRKAVVLLLRIVARRLLR